MSHPGGGSGTGPGGPAGPGPGRDLMPAGLLDVADALTVKRPPLAYVAGLAQVLLADALQLVDGGIAPSTVTDADAKHLASAAFHLEAAQRDLGHLTPARRDSMETRSQESAAVATTGGPVTSHLIQPHWHDLIGPVDFRLPRDVRFAGPPSPPVPLPLPPPQPGQPGGPRP